VRLTYIIYLLTYSILNSRLQRIYNIFAKVSIVEEIQESTFSNVQTG